MPTRSHAMSRIDEAKPFLPVNIALLTVSDTRHETDDKSGQTLADLAKRDGHHVVARTIVKDSVPAIVAQLDTWIADPAHECISSTRGTRLTGRDLTRSEEGRGGQGDVRPCQYRVGA